MKDSLKLFFMAEYYRVYERSLDVFLKIPNLSPFLRNLSVVLLPNDFSESLIKVPKRLC